MTRVRLIEVGDVEAVQRMAARFLSADGPYGARFTIDPNRIAALVTYMTTPNSDGVTFIVERDGVPVGMLGAFSLVHPILGIRVASELCWWMEPEVRGTRAALDMLRAAERWARDIGAAYFEMIAPNERVAEFYDRLGYERTDVHYLKSL